MKTTQQNFHPMRGHMEDKCEILCDNNEVLTLHAVMKGWQLRLNGKPIAPATPDAGLITRYIFAHGT